VQLDQPVRLHPDLFLGLLDLAARPRRAPRCLRHVAASLDRKAGNLPQPNCDCRTRWLLFCVRFVHEQVSWQTPGALSPDLEDLL
jgi:hypothetical protein